MPDAAPPLPRPKPPVAIRLWLALTALLPGLLAALARRMHRTQGADPARMAERLGQPSLARPQGALVWLHSASVGEAVSAQRLALAVAARPGTVLLWTTTTATGAATVARLAPTALHQFLPVDTPAAVSAFLAHWRPDAALFVEGDLWPRMILALAENGCPVALLNARASRSRGRFPAVFGALLARMRLVTVQDAGLLPGLAALGLPPDRLHAPGNLKADIAPPAVTKADRDALQAAARGRGLWAAVSTHPGEEEIVLDAQAALPGGPLLLLVPRHPERADTVAALIRQRGLTLTRHSLGERPGTGTAVHLVDVLGETGTVFAAAGLAFLGGSLRAGPGGHTPYEPAALGCAVLTGPETGNFTAAYQALRAAGAARTVADAGALAGDVAALLADTAALAAMQGAARSVQASHAGAVGRTLALLAPLLPEAAAAG